VQIQMLLSIIVLFKKMKIVYRLRKIEHAVGNRMDYNDYNEYNEYNLRFM
jgi:hypothetical protein